MTTVNNAQVFALIIETLNAYRNIIYHIICQYKILVYCVNKQLVSVPFCI